MKKRGMAILLTGVMLLSMAGCASSPDSAVVKEKNLDKMLEEAENTEDGVSSLQDVAEEVEKNYDTYQTQIQDDSLGVTVNVNAKVEIPEVEQLSVYRVSQKKIDQDFLDRVREALTPDSKYYEGRVLRVATKAEIAKNIQTAKDAMNNLEVDGFEIVDEVTLESYKEEYQTRIDQYEAEYESAPDSISLTDYPSDNQIHTVQELYDSHPGDDFYEWQYELNSSGEVYWGVNDGADGEYVSLYMQNNENYGNCLRYESTKNGYVFLSNVDVENGRDTSNVLKEEGKTPDFSRYTDAQAKAFDNEPATLSQEEARKQADALLEQLGLTDYQCYDGGLYSEMPWIESPADDGTAGYRDIYSFLYMRSIDGVFVNNAAGSKLVDEWRGEDYVKKLWGNEAVVVGVNDSGVVLFRYLTPISIGETVVEKTNIKSFNEIKDTFEEMVVIENASEEEDGEVSVRVTDVKLVYTRISEKDSFDTGLVVPVWDFEGTIVNEYGDERTGNILSINAIDGSVINSTLGY